MTATEARREATSVLRAQDGLNAEPGLMELAYSPLTGAVGMRWVWDGEPDGSFRVFNTRYPMYGRSEDVSDWVSVGIARAR